MLKQDSKADLTRDTDSLGLEHVGDRADGREEEGEMELEEDTERETRVSTP